MDIDALETGQLVTDVVFLVAEARLLVDRRGQSYYNLRLNCEGARQIDAKVWADNLAGSIKAGEGLEVLARVDEFQDKKQLNIQRYRILSPEEHDLSGFVRRTDIDVDQAFETLFNWQRDEFSNPWLKCLSAEFYSNASFAAQFKESPAASLHHHNYTGGLIEHTLEVWNLADGISKIHNGPFDRELLLCGAALHDVGKVKTYRLAAGISERTEVGQLLEHIFITGSMVSNVWDNVVRPQVSGDDAVKAARLKAMLLHIILSHHGLKEWGSPVLPCTPEALLVHYCDIISSTLHSSFAAIEKTQDGERWTDKVYIMDQPRRLFVTPKDEE